MVSLGLRTARAEAGLRAARDDLARRTHYFERLLDTLDIAVVSCDADGVLVFRNRVAHDATDGDTPRHVDDLAGLHEGDPRHPLARALNGEVFTHREMTLRPGGRNRAVMVDACPLTGTITARTNPAGHGTRITVTLPSQPSAAESGPSLLAPSAFATSAR